MLREPELPVAAHDEASRELKLLVDRREDLVSDRTRMINRFRWHLHELDPAPGPAEDVAGPGQALGAAAGRAAQPASTGWWRSWPATFWPTSTGSPS